MTNLVELKSTIKGEERILKVETDPTWGEFEEVIKNASTAGSPYALFEEITRASVKEGLPFDRKNRTEWKLLPLSEMTELVGKVMLAFPLGKYLDNLGIKDNPIFKTFLQ